MRACYRWAIIGNLACVMVCAIYGNWLAAYFAFTTVAFACMCGDFDREDDDVEEVEG